MTSQVCDVNSHNFSNPLFFACKILHELNNSINATTVKNNIHQNRIKTSSKHGHKKS